MRRRRSSAPPEAVVLTCSLGRRAAGIEPRRCRSCGKRRPLEMVHPSASSGEGDAMTTPGAPVLTSEAFARQALVATDARLQLRRSQLANTERRAGVLR